MQPSRKKKAANTPSFSAALVRLSRMIRRPDAPAVAPVTLRAWGLWAVVAGAIVIGVVLYFRHERSLTPLVG